MMHTTTSSVQYSQQSKRSVWSRGQFSTMHSTPAESNAIQFNSNERSATRSCHWFGSAPMRVRRTSFMKYRISASTSMSNENSSRPLPSLLSNDTKHSSGFWRYFFTPENFARRKQKERSAMLKSAAMISSDKKSKQMSRNERSVAVSAKKGCVPGTSTWGGCKDARPRVMPTPWTHVATPTVKLFNAGTTSIRPIKLMTTFSSSSKG
mmetsp:Transcript_65662/g.182720  ORF Transcript_65662/g.182720 Transcript_65662/m.182720 type:complete len:208 (+) Transcript_65662:386-1009(+)